MFELFKLVFSVIGTILKYWLDPERRKHERERVENEEQKKSRIEFAKAISNSDPIIVSHHISELLREVRSNRLARKRSAETD